MHFPPFLLDEWLAQKLGADPPVDYDLGSSTGPVWKLGDLLALEEGAFEDRLAGAPVFYSSVHGSRELREAIAAIDQTDPDWVQVVTGASEALHILFSLAAETGANVVLPKPGFPTNPALAQAFGIGVRYYALRPENGFRIDPDEIRRLVDRDTRFVLVNSPHNPTGAVLSDQEMEALHDFCAERGVQLVSDEVYHPIYHGASMRSAARLPHATTLGDFSKALCLSGLRTGWMIDRDPERRRKYATARNYLTISSSVICERLAALALAHRETIYARARRIASANLALLDDVFARHADLFDWVRPSGGMTAFPRLRAGADAREFCQRLLTRGVMIVPGDCFDMPEHFRLGFAASGERFGAAIERFEEFLGAARATASRAG